MMHDELFERASVGAIFVINFVNQIESDQFGEFAGINGIVFNLIFGNPGE